MLKEQEEESAGLSLRELYFTVFRHKTLIACVAGGFAVIAAAAALLFMKQTYESTANLLVRTGRESMAVDPTAGAGDQVRLRPREEEIRTEMEIIKSREVIDAVVTSLGMDFFLRQQEQSGGSIAGKFLKWVKKSFAPGSDRPPSPREEQKFRDGLIDSLMDQVEVEPVRSSSIFRVSLQGPSPEFAQRFLQRLIAVYLDKHSSMYFTDSAYMFINEKTDKFRNELEQVEKEITDFKNKASSLLIEEQRFLDQFATLQQEVRTTESELASAQAKAKVLQTKLGALTRETGSAAAPVDSSGLALDEISRRLSALRIQEQELLSTYTESSVPVQEVRRQIREIQAMLPRFSQRPGSGLSTAISQQSREGLQMELIAEESTVSSLQARLEVQRQKLAELQAQFQDVNEHNQTLVKLERRRAALEESYRKFSENLQQARIDQSLKLEKISNITIAQQPTYSLQPLKTKRMVVLLLGPFVGLFAALALAFFLETFDHSIRKPDDVQGRLNLRCLVSLPAFDNHQRLMPEINELPNLTIVPERMKSQFSSAPKRLTPVVVKYFDALLQSLLFAGEEQRGLPYIIAVTSARAGEGVSTVAANLAMRLARLGHGRVLLADMNPVNLDHEQEAKEPGRFPALGNMVALQGEKDSAELPAVLLDRLFLMQYSGQHRTETAIGEMQSMWGKDYEFVVMDVPPVLDNEGASIIARLAHKVILVIQAERERWQVIRRAQEMLEEVRANVIGGILNKRTLYIPAWLYRRL